LSVASASSVSSTACGSVIVMPGLRHGRRELP